MRADHVDPQEIIDGLERLGSGAIRTLTLDDRRFLALAAQFVADRVEMIAECDARPVTSAEIWDSVRDTIAGVLIGAKVSHLEGLPDRLTEIALGERLAPRPMDPGDYDFARIAFGTPVV